MKTFTKAILFLFSVAFLVHSCGRNDTLVGRNFHAVSTEFNTLYNGDIALQKGIATVNNAFTENFWELLPIERMEVKDEVRLSNEANNSDFERAEEKAIKAIQKHTITGDDGKEKNPQIDEAYLMLGKARYYDQRFVPALAAFNNILNKYPASDKINQVKVWREKSNMRLGSNEIAIKNLKRHLEQEEVKGQDLADISATLAEAFINIKKKDSALYYLKTAATETKVNNEKARYHFIIGQLYNEFGEKDNANLAFDAVIDLHRKIPRAFYINAHLAKATNFDVNSGDKIAFEEYLAELEENRENRPFLGKIYHRIAEYNREEELDSLSEAYYNKSLRATQGDQVLNARNYVTLGDMYFDRKAYKTAGSYYDSTLTNMVEKTKQYRVVKRKRENLEDVIYYEDIAKVNDSILYLVNLPKVEQVTVFEKLIENLKAQELAAEEQAKIQAAKSANSGGVALDQRPSFARNNRANLPGVNGPPGSGGSNFYFYNQTAVAFGKNEFLRQWGDRKLEDNWRFSNSRGSLNTNTEAIDNIVANATEDERYDPEFYIKTLPTEQTQIDSIAKERNYAYYQLGLIYKENFSEYQLAKSKFEALLKSNPEERLIIPSKYNLYKIYEILGQNGEAEITKNEILSKYPDSRYAEILRNPNSQLIKDENSAETIYEKLFRQFEKQEYAAVITSAEEQIKVFEGDGFVPKFEILKASALGRLKGFEAYKENVNYIALTYPNSEEGKRALEILNTAIPALENKEFTPDEDSNAFTVIYEFNTNEGDLISQFMVDLKAAIDRTNHKNLTLSKDVYNENTVFVVVHGLEFKTSALGFGQTLQDYKEDNTKGITRPHIAMSTTNYTIVQRHKNLSDYLNPE
ncbi:type IX secretion system periplasmic lipoprotein PorW/SprE [Winogradskyella immobilis]|uniref:Tetratricopeptide repeat protein n=1 Tax=Winogradskyella immobilis TaxID=2816852 RepID=A0ABS8EKG7_9FLAO|nr:tetratricopeptide repeat protein [Winogradskyella immobilis]MCC1483516.1 tetratricopeptide repeat protein [Winogradskyella immobilis]MCG0015610.1 tetratricopeptide repeat protein [Winogradskyella immobilis]